MSSGFGRCISLICASISICTVMSPNVLGEIGAGVPGAALSLVGYSASTGEVWVDDWGCSPGQDRNSPRADHLTTAHLLSDNALFTNHDAASSALAGLFDRSSPGKIFKLNPSGFGGVASFGNIAKPGIAESELHADLEFSSSAIACDGSQHALSYFPTPNLSNPNEPLESIGVIYRAVNGEIEFDVPEGVVVPWVGLYSADAIFSNSSDERDIATRIQYGYNVHESPSLGPVARARISRETLMGDLTVVASNETHEPVNDNLRLVVIPVGDINQDESIDIADIDQLTAEILGGINSTTSDLNQDGTVELIDRNFWVHDVMHTYFGDANLDGLFDSSDLSAVFQAGEYFDNVPGNSTWATGDWNGDADFNSGDLVAAFKDNGYEKGPRPRLQAVPELNPAYMLFVLVGLLFGSFRGQYARF